MSLPEAGSVQGGPLAALHAAGRHPYSSVQMVQGRFWVQKARLWSSEQEGWAAAVSLEDWVCSSVLMELAEAVALDMKDWWQPTPAYFGRMPKPLILAAVTEAKDDKAAAALTALKKGEMAAKASELLTGTGWLPAMLRAA